MLIAIMTVKKVKWEAHIDLSVGEKSAGANQSRKKAPVSGFSLPENSNSVGPVIRM
jgi:hypothetical protein